MKIVICNTALSNTGDAAIMLGTRAILENAIEAELEFSVRDQQPALVRREYPEFPVRPLFYERLSQYFQARFLKIGIIWLLVTAWLIRTPFRGVVAAMLPDDIRGDLLDMAGADLVLAAGGTYLVPHYRIRPVLLELMIARALGKPYVLFTQSLGPFDSRDAKWLKPCLRGATAIFIRDAESKKHLERIGIVGECVFETADAAFALAGNKMHGRRRQSRPAVAMSVRYWPHFSDHAEDGMDRYIDAIITLTAHLIDNHDARIEFISTCQGREGYWTDDSQLAERIAARLPERYRNNVAVNGESHRPEALLSRLREFDLIVATRMHVAILGLAAGVPVLPIAYEFKTRELFRKINKGRVIADIETVTGDVLCRETDRMLERYVQYRHEIAGHVSALRQSALGAGHELRRRLEKI